MNRRTGVFVLFFLVLALPVFAQQRLTISGQIKDAVTGEDLIGAVLSIKDLPTKSIGTNTYGFYSVTLPEGSYEITAQYTGYKPQVQQIKLDRSLKLNFSLTEQPRELDEVVVYGRRKDENVTKTRMGLQKLNTREIKNIPVLFGEKDVLKTIQLLPGIQAAGEGRSGFNVRGGSADQNLILLDEAIVYNASHLMGFFSVFTCSP